jgi:hypothetical protein
MVFSLQLLTPTFCGTYVISHLTHTCYMFHPSRRTSYTRSFNDKCLHRSLGRTSKYSLQQFDLSFVWRILANFYCSFQRNRWHSCFILWRSQLRISDKWPAILTEVLLCVPSQSTQKTIICSNPASCLKTNRSADNIAVDWITEKTT